jgi:hypothetical protein
MAEDIYNLIQKGLAERRAGASQFRDPLVDIALQVPQWIANERDKVKIKETSALNDIVQLIPLANTREGLDNIQSNLEGLSISSENKLKADILNEVVLNRSAQYDAATPYVQEIYDSYNLKDASKDKFNLTVDGILSHEISDVLIPVIDNDPESPTYGEQIGTKQGAGAQLY